MLYYRIPHLHGDRPLAAWGLSRLPSSDSLAAAVELMAATLLAAYADESVATDQALRAAYAVAQKFDSDASYSQDATDGYIDLADFAAQLAVRGLVTAEVADRVVAMVPGCHGVGWHPGPSAARTEWESTRRWAR